MASGAVASMAVNEKLSELTELADGMDEDSLVVGGAVARLLQLQVEMFKGQTDLAGAEKLPAVIRPLKPLIKGLGAFVFIFDAEVEAYSFCSSHHSCHLCNPHLPTPSVTAILRLET